MVHRTGGDQFSTAGSELAVMSVDYHQRLLPKIAKTGGDELSVAEPVSS